MGRFFPLALVLEGRSCLVIGSGAEAVRRASALLEAGAVRRNRDGRAVG